MIYAVIDTNILVSAMLTHNPQAATARVLDYIVEGVITPVYNDDIISEYQEVLNRPKFSFDPLLVKYVLDYFRHYGIQVQPAPYEGCMPDEKDRAFYEVSLGLPDSFLVTGNLKHFPSTPRVLSPSEMAALIESLLGPTL